MAKSRNNHYVPEWYQKGFILNGNKRLHYLDLSPTKIQLANGEQKTLNGLKFYSPCVHCFN